MNLYRQKKLGIIVAILFILSLVTALVLYALRQNINLFYTPSQVFSKEAPYHKEIRLGGMVEKNSIRHEKGSVDVQFRLTDNEHSILVRYHGSLPDLFREGQGIVTQGKLINEEVFFATEVFAKHDANYMPPELKRVISKKS